MQDLSPQARRLLDQGLTGHSPPPGAKARLRARLPAAVAAPSLAAREAERGLDGGSGTGAHPAVALGGAALGLTLGLSALSALTSSSRSPGLPTVERNAESLSAARFDEVRFASSPASPEPESLPAPRDFRPRRPAAPAMQTPSIERRPATEPRTAQEAEPAAVSSGSSLAEEARILAAARGALRDGDLELVMVQVEAHASRFPNGALRAERWAAEALAACAQADDARAKRATADLEALDPRSPHLPRIRRACSSL